MPRLTLRTPIASRAPLTLGNWRSLLPGVTPPPIDCARLSRLVLPRTVHRNFGVAGPVDTRDLHKHHMTFAMFHRSHYEVSLLVFVCGFTFVGLRDFSCSKSRNIISWFQPPTGSRLLFPARVSELVERLVRLKPSIDHHHRPLLISALMHSPPPRSLADGQRSRTGDLGHTGPTTCASKTQKRQAEQ
jgi:hypothetical protein